MKLFSRPILGLDIGSAAVKAALLTRKKDRVELTAAALLDFPKELLKGSDETLREAAIVETLKKFFKQNGFKTKQVVIGLRGDAVLPRFIRSSAVSPEEFRKNLSSEAEQYIPLSLDQVVLDFHVLQKVEEEGQKRMEILLVAAKNDAVDAHLEMLRKAKLQARVIDVDALALQNTYEFNVPQESGETIALLNVGAALTTLNILEGKLIRFTRDITVAGNDFTKEIQKEFQLSFPEAEELKRAQGTIVMEEEDMGLSVAPTADDRMLRLSDAMVPVLNKLLGEIRRSFDFYETQARKKTVERVILSGGGAKLKNLNRFLAGKLGIPVEPFHPFRNLEMGKGLDAEEWAEKESRMAVAVGLALRGLEPA